MNNSNEFRICREAIDDIATSLISFGFEKVVEDIEFITLRLPQGWEIITSEDSGKKYFKDKNGNIRGGIIHFHIYLNCRYELTLVSVPEKYYPDDSKLLLRDNKTGKVIMDFGYCESYSDYEKDLIRMARDVRNLKFPNCEDPMAYWED